uniref:Uncharacterized protein n=1 Tax=Mycena chlorophos TaxID=658473 RepID=A0ABQ0L8U7_MYCCL|nr:predicted protein [Mycena chlorophos]
MAGRRLRVLGVLDLPKQENALETVDDFAERRSDKADERKHTPKECRHRPREQCPGADGCSQAGTQDGRAIGAGRVRVAETTSLARRISRIRAARLPNEGDAGLGRHLRDLRVDFDFAVAEIEAKVALGLRREILVAENYNRVRRRSNNQQRDAQTTERSATRSASSSFCWTHLSSTTATK